MRKLLEQEKTKSNTDSLLATEVANLQQQLEEERETSSVQLKELERRRASLVTAKEKAAKALELDEALAALQEQLEEETVRNDRLIDQQER